MSENAWQIRRASLETLGFTSYQDYLDSELWQTIRRQVLDRDLHRCRCRKAATQVHHSDYSVATLRGERLHRLVSVCRRCHEIGSLVDGRVVSPVVTDARLKILRMRTRTAKQRRRLARMLPAATERAQRRG